MNTTMNYMTQYADFVRPSWAPPAWIFGPVWTVLYILIGISFGYMIYKWAKGKVSSNMIMPFLLNLMFNFAFTPIQFGLMNMPLATIDILLVLVTLIWAMRVAWKKYRWVALMNIPYLLWVSFATVLQITVFTLNS